MSSSPHRVCWYHIIWSTDQRKPLLSRVATAETGMALDRIATKQQIEIAAVAVRPDHVHMLLNLPNEVSLDRTVHALQRGSQKMLKRRKLLPDGFGWESEYAAFSVSVGMRHRVRNYILRQNDVHAEMTFAEEWSRLVAQAGLPDHLYGSFEARMNAE